MEEKLLYSSTDNLEIDHICALLKDNNITYIKKTDGVGDYLTIATGSLFKYTIKVFVSSSDYEKANELINAVNSSAENIQTTELPDELKDISAEEEKEMDEKARKTNDTRKRRRPWLSSQGRL